MGVDGGFLRSFFRRTSVYFLPFLFLALFCLWPLGTIARYGLTDASGSFTLGNLATVLSDPIYLDIICFTFWQAVVSSLVTVLLAIPGAYLFARYSFPAKRMIMAATTVPFVIPSLVLAVGLIAIFGYNGSVNSVISSVNGMSGSAIPRLDLIGTRTIILLAHVFFNFPIALRILHARYVNMDADLVRAARSLGAGKARTFLTITVPQLKYSLLAAASLVFTFCFLSFGIVVLVGGLNHTIEVEIRALFIGLTGEKFHHAGALLVLETLIVMAATYLYVWSSSRDRSRAEIAFGTGGGIKKRMKSIHRVGVVLYCLVVAAVVVYPLLIVATKSLSLEGLSFSEMDLDNYRSVITLQRSPGLSISPLDAIRNSLLFGLLTTVVSVPLSYLTALGMRMRGGVPKRLLDMMLLFPLGASSIALGYGLVKAYSSGPVQLGGTWYIVVLVHSVIAYPIGARSIYSSMMSVPENAVRAARSLGASRLEAFMRVQLPLLMPGILVAAVFAFAVSVGELGATLMVSSEELMTMPVYLYRTIEGAGREMGPMYAFSVILMSITFISFLSIELIQRALSRWGLER